MEIYVYIGICLLISYLSGSIPFAFIYGKVIKGIDIRQHGSGNIGATNVLRVFGTIPGIIVLLLDILKGFLPVYLFKLLIILPSEYSYVPIAMGLCAILGHTFTVFLSFKGGKGVATAAGVCLALMPLFLLGALLIFIITVSFTRYVSAGSILASLCLLLMEIMSFWGSNTTIYEYETYSSGSDIYRLIFVCILVFFIVYKHKSNIYRLLNGTENKITFKKK